MHALVGWVVYRRLLRTCADCEISERTKNETFARYKKQNNELKSTKKKLKRTEGNCTVG